MFFRHRKKTYFRQNCNLMDDPESRVSRQNQFNVGFLSEVCPAQTPPTPPVQPPAAPPMPRPPAAPSDPAHPLLCPDPRPSTAPPRSAPAAAPPRPLPRPALCPAHCPARSIQPAHPQLRPDPARCPAPHPSPLAPVPPRGPGPSHAPFHPWARLALLRLRFPTLASGDPARDGSQQPTGEQMGGDLPRPLRPPLQARSAAPCCRGGIGVGS